MATSSYIYEILQGAAAEAAAAITFIGIGSQGTQGAKRILTHPNNSLPPIVYYKNPDRTLNLDNVALSGPRIRSVLTGSSTRVVRFEGQLEDVIATEMWEGARQRFSMPTSFWRELYEYLINPPPFSASAQTYIQWEPRDRTAKKYNVEFIGLVTGNPQGFDVLDWREPGGIAGGGTIANATDFLDVLPTGLVDVPVALAMRVVNEAA